MAQDYKDAANALRLVLSNKHAWKTAVFNSNPRNVKRCFGLVAEATKRLPLLQTLLKSLGPEGQNADEAMLLVLLQEHLFGKSGKIMGGGALKRLIVQNDAALRKVVAAAGPQESTSSGADDSSSSWPRYVRVNTLASSSEEVVAALLRPGGAEDDGTAPRLSRLEVRTDQHLPMVLVLPNDAHQRLSLHAHPLVVSGMVVLQDKASAMPPFALLADVLEDTAAARAGAGGAAGAPIGSGHILAQPDGATPLPLGPGPFDAIDACAAPGNKTTQLAALLAQLRRQSGGVGASLSNAGGAPGGSASGGKRKRGASETGSGATSQLPRVYAFDRSAPRLATLRQRVAGALGDSASGALTPSSGGGADVTVARHRDVEVVCEGGDFTASSPDDPRFARLRVVLLDPSCSGSGMVRAHGNVAEETGTLKEAPRPPASEAGRVASLSSFQLKALEHALSFPQVVRVSYSTCSVYAAEDEEVVRKAQESFNGARHTHAESGRVIEARLVPVLPEWRNRGIPLAQSEGVSVAVPIDYRACIRCDPNADQTGGFFVAVIHKFLLPSGAS